VRTGQLLGPHSLGVVIAGMTAAAPSLASAAEASPRFAGEHGHATATNTTALFYNPAALRLTRGNHIFLDDTVSLRFGSYTRPAAGPDDVAPGHAPVQDSQVTLTRFPGANDGEANGFTITQAPFVGVSSDFGTRFVTAAIGYYVPFEGTIRWGTNPAYAGNLEAQGAIDGVARWHSIETIHRTSALSVGIAFEIRRAGLSLGVTGSALHTRFEYELARSVDGTDDLVDPAGFAKEGRRSISARGWHGGFTLGAVLDVAKRGVGFIGLAYTSQPNVAGGLRLEGTLRESLPYAAPTSREITVWQTLPDSLRLSIRVRPNERGEFRLSGEWTRWSVFDHQCVAEGDVDDDPCGGAADPAIVDWIPRAWTDAFAVRVGGSYWFRAPLEGFLGIGYESPAAPASTLDASAPALHTLSPAVGLRWQVIEAFAISTTWTERIGLARSTGGRSDLNERPLPQRRPSADGVYRHFTQLFNVYAELRF